MIAFMWDNRRRRTACATSLFYSLVLPCLFHLLAMSGGAQSLSASPPSFTRDVMAVLSRAGCNMGACHGNLNGKGGLKLSLRGQDPELDYLTLTHELGGRRINRNDPGESLMLMKATARLAHQGGQRFSVESPEYQLVLDWIRSGCSQPDESLPGLRALHVEPQGLTVATDTRPIPIRVIAEFEDGWQRDVTQLAAFEASNFVVRVDPRGLIHRLQDGEASVSVRYLGLQQSVRVAFVPPDAAPSNDVATVPRNVVDQHIYKKLDQLRLSPLPPAEDYVFLRRAYLDTLGLLPSSEETQRFVQDSRLDKRAQLIDELLARPEFASHWALKWSDLLRNEEKLLDREGVSVFYAWLRDAFARNVRLDQLVAELVAARGSTYETPPANFYRALRDPLLRGESAARLFLGVRLECAKCHNHPFDHWTQDDYYEWAAVFAQIDYEIVENNRKDKFDKQEFVGEQRVVMNAELSVKNPRTGETARPRFLAREAVRPEPDTDPLEALAQWLTGPGNRDFARAQTNRIWFQLMGRGLVDPVDDFRVTNPPSHPRLLDALAEELIESGFDLRHLVRIIMNSAVYQAETLGDDQDLLAASNYVGVQTRRLTAEQLLDAQSHVLGMSAEFNGYEAGTRAGELAGVQRVRLREKRPSADDRFLILFGKPQRLMSCECERSDDTTLSQALNLIGGPSLHRRLSDPENQLGQWAMSDLSNEQIIRELFWTALSRPPNADEEREFLGYLDRSDRRLDGLRDVTWALLNSKEFLFRY